jgi:hypothetical protein
LISPETPPGVWRRLQRIATSLPFSSLSAFRALSILRQRNASTTRRRDQKPRCSMF